MIELIDLALAEDLGDGDWTTKWTVPDAARGTGEIVAKDDLVVAGTEVARAVFHRLEPDLEIRIHRGDGEAARPGDVVLSASGSAHAILSAERTALNFVGRLSGIATATRRFVEAIDGTGARVVDTRKTTPGWRRLEKAAVRAGGGENHRFGLYDMVLVKENHIAASGGIAAALEAVRAQNTRRLAVEVEVTSLDELEEALTEAPDRVLLDNMEPRLLLACVSRVRDFRGPQPLLEASGGVTLASVREVAETGVDLISVGALTHSAPSADLSLRFLPHAREAQDGT